MSEINDLLAQKMNIYEQLVVLIKDEMLNVADRQKITNGDINMVDELYVLDGGHIDMIYEKPTPENLTCRLHSMKNIYSMDILFAMESSFSRSKRIKSNKQNKLNTKY